MARTSGTSSKWGSYLDSTLDRLGDGAIFGGLVLFYADSRAGDSTLMAAVTLWALVMGATTSYARAKAESLGLQASGGLAERVRPAGRGAGDRRSSPTSSTCRSCSRSCSGALAVASTITVVQRIAVGPQAGPADPQRGSARNRRSSTTADPPAPARIPDVDGLRQRAVDLAFALAWTLVRRLPEAARHRLFRRVADFVRTAATVAACGGCAGQSRRRSPGGVPRRARRADAGRDAVVPALLAGGVPAARVDRRADRRPGPHGEREGTPRRARRRQAA